MKRTMQVVVLAIIVIVTLGQSGATLAEPELSMTQLLAADASPQLRSAIEAGEVVAVPMTMVEDVSITQDAVPGNCGIGYLWLNKVGVRTVHQEGASPS